MYRRSVRIFAPPGQLPPGRCPQDTSPRFSDQPGQSPGNQLWAATLTIEPNINKWGSTLLYISACVVLKGLLSFYIYLNKLAIVKHIASNSQVLWSQSKISWRSYFMATFVRQLFLSAPVPLCSPPPVTPLDLMQYFYIQCRFCNMKSQK